MKKAASINLDQHQSSSPRISKAITAEPVIKPANLAECETFEGKTQCAEWILDKIAKATNKTFTGLKCMFQGFRIYFL